MVDDFADNPKISLSMPPLFASLGMKTSTDGSSNEGAVKGLLFQSLTSVSLLD